MKTPRQFLLDRHRPVEPKLDEIRRAVIAQHCTSSGKRSESPRERALLATLWRELILPARRTWAGLAAVWLLIGVIYVAQAGSETQGAANSTRVSPDLLTAWIERQHDWVELATPDHVGTAESEKPKQTPGPRSELLPLLGRG